MDEKYYVLYYDRDADIYRLSDILVEFAEKYNLSVVMLPKESTLKAYDKDELRHLLRQYKMITRALLGEEDDKNDNDKGLRC